MQSKHIVDYKSLINVIIGSLLLAFASSFFYLPHSIVSGGISGIAIIINHLIVTDISFLNEEFYILVLQWLFFVIGIFTLGKKFCIQTLCSTIVYPIGVYIFTYIYNLVPILHLESNTINYLLAALFGGVLTGVGCGLTFIGGGSTGGVDIPALIFYKYFKLRVSIGSFLIDTLIILSGVFVIQKFDLALIGIVAAFAAAIAMDKVFFGGKTSYMAYIVSNKYEEINDFILNKMERGTTLFTAQGGYSKKDLKVILICFNIKEYFILKNAIKIIDPCAFVSVVQAHEITGEGFQEVNDSFDTSKLDEWLNKKQGKNNE